MARTDDEYDYLFKGAFSVALLWLPACLQPLVLLSVWCVC